MAWNTDAVANAFRQRAFNKLVRGGIVLRNCHKQDLEVRYPPASVPGEFPHRRTGRLLGGVLLQAEPQASTVRVSSTTPYNLPLMRSGRRTLWHSFVLHRAQIAKEAV